MLGMAVVLAIAANGRGTTGPQTDERPWVGPAVRDEVRDRAHGGMVRVAVPTPPEFVDTGPGGETLRQLTYPALFVARPDGQWRASLVEPGSDRGAKDALSASFRLRAARWSDGRLIDAEDLRRTADARFVAGVDGPRLDGVITVRFTQRLPGWRRLWSGSDAIDPPSLPTGAPADVNGVAGGPFVVASVTSGLETVLHRNPGWLGPGPFLEEVRLVLIPDQVTSRQLIARGEIDVVTPAADTMRTPQWQAIEGVAVDAETEGGGWVALRTGNALSEQSRRVISEAFPARAFVDSLLAGEAGPVQWFAQDGALPDVEGRSGDGVGALDGSSLTITLPSEQPLTPELGRALQRGSRERGGSVDVRVTSRAGIDRLLTTNTYDVALAEGQVGPDPCWSCLFETAQASLAARADAGDTAARGDLLRLVIRTGSFLPLWQPAAVTAWRPSVVQGVEANGFTSGLAWDAERWWRP